MEYFGSILKESIFENVIGRLVLVLGWFVRGAVFSPCNTILGQWGPDDKIEYLQRKERPTIGKLRWVHNQMELVCVFLLSASSESEAENLEAQPQSTVRPEEISIPENRFLMAEKVHP